MGEGDTLLNAVVGAAVTVVLSFTGVSPLLGGGVAGYLQREGRRRGATVGALSGALAALPSLVVVVAGLLLFAGVVPMGMGPMMGRGFGVPGGVGPVMLLFVLLPALLVWNVGLGAAGGYLGAYVREESLSADERVAAR